MLTIEFDYVISLTRSFLLGPVLPNTMFGTLRYNSRRGDTEFVDCTNEFLPHDADRQATSHLACDTCRMRKVGAKSFNRVIKSWATNDFVCDNGSSNAVVRKPDVIAAESRQPLVCTLPLAKARVGEDNNVAKTDQAYTASVQLPPRNQARRAVSDKPCRHQRWLEPMNIAI